MKIIAVMNQKGGIGKTMTAASIAYILGQEQEKKVLVIDADQQGNISMLYGAYDPEGRGLPDLLENHEREGGTYTTSELIQTTPYDRIDIIPCNGYLMNTNMYLMKTEGDSGYKKACYYGNIKKKRTKDILTRRVAAVERLWPSFLCIEK